MIAYERELKNFRQLNKIAKRHGVVLFGSSFAKEIPVCELKQTFDLDCAIYNRSITDLSVFDAKDLLEDCVDTLKPTRILLQLGETDLERGYKTIPEIISAYESILTTLKEKNKNSDIIILSICDNHTGIYPDELNKHLSALAAKMHCKYADISSALSDAAPEVKAFSLLKGFLRDRVTFSDAVNMLCV